MKTIDRTRLQSLMQREQKKFVDERPKSKALFERARKSLLAGVPMNWMVKWAGATANLSSRHMLIKAALQENALLLAAHMPVGRVEGTLEHYRWVSL